MEFTCLLYSITQKQLVNSTNFIGKWAFECSTKVSGQEKKKPGNLEQCLLVCGTCCEAKAVLLNKRALESRSAVGWNHVS